MNVSGNLTNGAKAGVRYRNANNDSANRNTNIRGQLTACSIHANPCPGPCRKRMALKVLVGTPKAPGRNKQRDTRCGICNETIRQFVSGNMRS
jgi:hypothetical protein